jgi:hypothetical protein
MPIESERCWSPLIGQLDVIVVMQCQKDQPIDTNWRIVVAFTEGRAAVSFKSLEPYFYGGTGSVQKVAGRVSQ